MDEPTPPLPRSRVEIVDGVEQLVLRYPGSRVVIVFFTVWTLAWAAGCGAGVYALTLVGIEPALVIFLLFWLGAGLLVLTLLSWQLAGEEVVRVEIDGLIHAVRAPGWRRRHAYPIGEIADLSWDSGPPPFDRRYADNPPLRFGLSGVVKFQHGGRTVRMGQNRSEAEGRIIVDWLAPRVPQGALTVSP